MQALLRLTLLLLFVDFLDEAAGIASVALPDIQGEFGVSYATIAFAAFTVPGLVAMLCEPPLLLWADRTPHRRRAFVTVGLAVMGAALCATSLTTGPVAFALCTAVAWTASGVGTNLARATLMDADPERRELWMARWVMFGTVGDLAAPLLLGALAWVALGWRTAVALVGGALIVYAGLLATRTFPAVDEVGDEEQIPWTAALREALGNRRLLLWLLGVSTCGLLDEAFVAFGSAWLEVTYGATLVERGLIFGVGTAGAIAGLVVQERALARGLDPVRWLLVSGIGCGVALVAWIAAPTLLWSAVLLVVLEFGIAQLYPIAMAQAYRALPDRAAMVDAMGGLFAPLDLLAPLFVGWVADVYGLGPALLLLGLQPVSLVVLAAGVGRPEEVDG